MCAVTCRWLTDIGACLRASAWLHSLRLEYGHSLHCTTNNNQHHRCCCQVVFGLIVASVALQHSATVSQFPVIIWRLIAANQATEWAKIGTLLFWVPCTCQVTVHLLGHHQNHHYSQSELGDKQAQTTMTCLSQISACFAHSGQVISVVLSQYIYVFVLICLVGCMHK